MKQIILKENNGKMEMSFKGEMTFESFMTMMLSMLDGQTQQFLANATKDLTEEQASELKEHTYDELNFLFGQILERIIPDGSENFDDKLTAEAILKAENDIIRRKYNRMSYKEKKKARSRYQRVLKDAKPKS